MPGPFGSPLSLCCGSCECPQRVCVTPHCGSITFPFRIIDGVTVEVREAADPPGSGDLLGTCTNEAPTGCCVELDIEEATDVDLVISKDGYHTKTLGPYTVGCETGLSLAVVMYPTEADICVQIDDWCEGVENNAIIDTDAGVSGVTVDGEWCDTIAIDEDGEPSEVHVSVTIDGDCFDPNPITGVIRPYCNPVFPGPGFENVGRFVIANPSRRAECGSAWGAAGVLTWADQYGSVVLDQPGWISPSWPSIGGRMTWADETWECALCGPYGSECWFRKYKASGTVSAWIEAAFETPPGSSFSCGTRNVRVYRHVTWNLAWDDCAHLSACGSEFAILPYPCGVGPSGPVVVGECAYKIVFDPWPNGFSAECDASPGRPACTTVPVLWAVAMICYQDFTIEYLDHCWTFVGDSVTLDQGWSPAGPCRQWCIPATGSLSGSGCHP